MYNIENYVGFIFLAGITIGVLTGVYAMDYYFKEYIMFKDRRLNK